MTWQRCVLAILIGIVLTVATTRTVGANEGPELEAYEAKIEARQLDDGSIEVAVRAREIGGEWGDRLYPTNSLFWRWRDPWWTIPAPNDYSHHWVASGQIGADLYYGPGPSYTYERGHGLRIVARRHEDGRTEIALRANSDPGVWTSPMIFPTRRFFPADPGSVWYESSTVTISTALVAPDGFPSEAVASFVYEDALDRLYHYIAVAADYYEGWLQLTAEIAAFAAALGTVPILGTHDCLPGTLRHLGLAAQALAEAAEQQARASEWGYWERDTIEQVTTHIQESMAVHIVCLLPV
ncbi:MAG: hypothetical protein F4X98_18145 [Gammaproteobacteria bacterium]|nr:hypothetical protein [Gammaproteobacteria bacterium]